MICPKCNELGLKSKVFAGFGMTTCAYYQPYYDENGKYHCHDGNNSTTTNSCSNGHRFIVKHAKGCPSCDWGYPESLVVLDDDNQSITLNNTSGIIVLNECKQESDSEKK